MTLDLLDIDALRNLPVVGSDPPAQVKNCQASHFRQLVRTAIDHHPARSALRTDLYGLFFRSEYDRIEALRLLHRYGVDLRLVVNLDEQQSTRLG